MSNLIYSILKVQNEAIKNGKKGPFTCTIGMELYHQFIEETRELGLFNVHPYYTMQVSPGKFYVGKVFDVSVYVLEIPQEWKENLILEAYEKQLKQ